MEDILGRCANYYNGVLIGPGQDVLRGLRGALATSEKDRHATDGLVVELEGDGHK